MIVVHIGYMPSTLSTTTPTKHQKRGPLRHRETVPFSFFMNYSLFRLVAQYPADYTASYSSYNQV
jgi:hypothetical protein